MSTQLTTAPLMLSISGCRGIVGASLTPEVVCRFIGAVVGWLREDEGVDRPRVVLGNDGRLGGGVLRSLASYALSASGCDVIDLGVAMTPTMGVMVTERKADAGITLTASHNPAEWNGLKVISRQGSAPDASTAARIIDRFRAGAVRSAAPSGFGTITAEPAAAMIHVRRVLDALARVASIEAIRERRFRVVVNSVNASGVEGAARLARELNCELIHIHAEASGVFPHPPEPTAENLSGMRDEVRKREAHVGFAQDPDADRLAIIDERGAYIGEEYTLVLSAMAVLGAPAVSANGARLVANLSTSRMLDDVAARFGARVSRSAVGEANVVSIMQREGALLGGEGNGGVIWPEVTLIRDSLSAMALTLALMAREGGALSAIVSSTPSYAIEKRKIDLKPGLTERALAAARESIRGDRVRVDDQDGVRLDFPAPGGKGEAWVHVRASNTEPIIRLIAEAPTSSEARGILDRVATAVDRG